MKTGSETSRCINNLGTRIIHHRRRCYTNVPSFFFFALLIVFFIADFGNGDGNTYNADENDADDNDDVSSEITTEDSIMMIGKVLEEQQKQKKQQEQQNDLLHENDPIDDGIFDPFSPDPSCSSSSPEGQEDCWAPPKSTLEEDVITVDVENESCSDDGKNLSTDQSTPKQEEKEVCKKKSTTKKKVVDKHWGSDENILKMRDKLRKSPSSSSTPSTEKSIYSSEQKNQNPHKANIRPPVFLMPGLASTRLVSWKFKQCKAHHALLSDIKVQDYVWLNINLLVQMATIDVSCWSACMTLGMNQTDGILEDALDSKDNTGANTKNASSAKSGCKLRPDEGLDAISSLAPGSLSSELLVGGTNTVYAWLTQWLADNLGYDVGSIVGLPYDWRLSPDVMEDRDGFLTLTRRRIEAAVKTNGLPGIMVAHSMGNVIFRYFLEWMRNELREEAYARYVKRAERRAATALQQSTGTATMPLTSSLLHGGGDGSPASPSSLPGWMGGVPPHKMDFDKIADYIESGAGSDGGRGDHKNNHGNSADDKYGNSVGDRMYTFANSFVAGVDDLFRTYFPNFDVAKSRAEKGGGGDGNPTNSLSSAYSTSKATDHSSSTKEEVDRESDRHEEYKVEEEEQHHQQHQQHQQQPEKSTVSSDDRNRRHAPLWELAQIEGDVNWIEWINDHIWTYVGLSAPLLGAVNPLRAVLSGENMGLPITDEVARGLELSFGSTHTVNPISTKMGFCDIDNTDGDGAENDALEQTEINRSNLACLDELVSGIEKSRTKTPLSQEDPWADYNALRLLLKERVDWDTDFPMIQVSQEQCQKSEKARPCANREELNFGPRHVQNGTLFTKFHEIWNEENDPLLRKKEQLETSFWNTPFQNILRTTWDRPHIKHVVMAYGVDVPTEVGYVYRKEEEYKKEDNTSSSHSASTADGKNGYSSETSDATSDTTISSRNGNDSRKKESKTTKRQYDGIPGLHKVIWEEANGKLMEVPTVTKPTSLTESLVKKKPKKQSLGGGDGNGKLHHSGDGTIPYLSLIWAHTWLLHATRAMRHSGHAMKEGERISDDNALDSIFVSHRPKGGSEWINGCAKRLRRENEEGKNGKGFSAPDPADDDTGTRHPHGTKYKPEMHRFQSEGKSRSTGMEYTTTVIEAIGVEHKETTRNYDILAAVFTDVLKYMHDDFGLV